MAALVIMYRAKMHLCSMSVLRLKQINLLTSSKQCGHASYLLGMRRTKYLGDWSAACILGLLTGLTILILQRYMSADAVHQLLTFNPADFFTYASHCICAWLDDSTGFELQAVQI